LVNKTTWPVSAMPTATKDSVRTTSFDHVRAGDVVRRLVGQVEQLAADLAVEPADQVLQLDRRPHPVAADENVQAHPTPGPGLQANTGGGIGLLALPCKGVLEVRFGVEDRSLRGERGYRSAHVSPHLRTRGPPARADPTGPNQRSTREVLMPWCSESFVTTRCPPLRAR
jgi:hypothetical protein